MFERKDDFGVIRIYPFVDEEKDAMFPNVCVEVFTDPRFAPESGNVRYQGGCYTEAQFNQLSEAFSKAFELVKTDEK